MDFWECGNITFIDYRLKVYTAFTSKDFGYISVTDKYPISKDTFLLVNTVGSVPEGDQAFVIRKTTGKVQAYRLKIGVYSGCIVY